MEGSQANFVIWLANNGTGVLQVLLTLPEYAESDLSSFKLNRNETISVSLFVAVSILFEIGRLGFQSKTSRFHLKGTNQS